MAELFKFRCYQCQKLLGVKPSRIGSTTTCPRCGTGLIIPEPLESGGVEPSTDDDDTPAVNLEDLGLRLEPETLSLAPAPAPRPPEPGPSPVAFLETLDAEPEPKPDDEEPEIEGPDDALTTPLAPSSTRPGRGGRPTVIRSRDVILPRTVLIAWSLSALLGIASAFAAGMLIGHFLWR